jgi:hypothetical protein
LRRIASSVVPYYLRWFDSGLNPMLGSELGGALPLAHQQIIIK